MLFFIFVIIVILNLLKRFHIITTVEKSYIVNKPKKSKKTKWIRKPMNKLKMLMNKKKWKRYVKIIKKLQKKVRVWYNVIWMLPSHIYDVIIFFYNMI